VVGRQEFSQLLKIIIIIIVIIIIYLLKVTLFTRLKSCSPPNGLVLFCSLASVVVVVVVCRRLSGSVTLHGRPAGGFSRAGQTMTSRRLQCIQSNYSSMVSLHGGPVRLHPVRATPCFTNGITGNGVLSVSLGR